MTPAKATRIEQSLNGIARKVLEATPIQSPWSLTQIIGELRRCGYSASQDVVLGSLCNMVRLGLVRESSPRSYIRTAVKDRAETASNEDIVEMPAPPPPTAPALPQNPIDKLTMLATQLRLLAGTLDDIALEVDEHITSIKGDSDKLKQLGSLLKNLGVGS
jgi:hypothetical protein